MPAPSSDDVRRELGAAIDMLRERSKDLRRDSDGLRGYSHKLRAKSGRLQRAAVAYTKPATLAV